jgi:hypothetical protein
LADDIFSESMAAGKGSGKQGSIHGSLSLYVNEDHVVISRMIQQSTVVIYIDPLSVRVPSVSVITTKCGH